MYELRKERYRELKYFCRQYPYWKVEYDRLNGMIAKGKEDTTAKAGSERADYNRAMSLIERTATDTDPEYRDYILKAVTSDCPIGRVGAPCDDAMFVTMIHKFYWLLSNRKGI